jgi:hypothetical protein
MAVTRSKVSVEVPLAAPKVAVMVEPPAVFPRPVARPPAVMETFDGVPDDQVTWEVRSTVVPLLLQAPVAVICCVVPVLKLLFPGVTEMEEMFSEMTVLAPEMAPRVAVMAESPIWVPFATRPPEVTVAFSGYCDDQVTWEVTLV